MIPLRSPFPGAPPRYVAVPTSRNSASSKSTSQPHKQSKKNPASIVAKESEEAVSNPSSQAPKAVPAAAATSTATTLMQRARSVPLQEMREATVAVRDNSRLGRDGSMEKRSDDLHPLKYWARQKSADTEGPPTTVNVTRSSTGSCEV